jgi:hypothetical protein
MRAYRPFALPRKRASKRVRTTTFQTAIGKINGFLLNGFWARLCAFIAQGLHARVLRIFSGNT